jgi:O-acetyl-ADP-ribose deacetylase (regulator of RNase III)
MEREDPVVQIHVQNLLHAADASSQRHHAGMRIELLEGDVTAQEVDAVVNAANSSLLGGGGVDGAIHRKGGPAIIEECRRLRATRYPDGLPAGEAVATTAGDLPASWVIHTVGPVYDHARDLSGTLRGCYTSSLAVADGLGARVLAFPLISAGAFGWPLEDAVHQALTALRSAETSVEEARLVLFGEATFAAAQRVGGTS